MLSGNYCWVIFQELAAFDGKSLTETMPYSTQALPVQCREPVLQCRVDRSPEISAQITTNNDPIIELGLLYLQKMQRKLIQENATSLNTQRVKIIKIITPRYYNLKQFV